MAKLTVCTLDIESFWSTTHSLSRMSPIVYCTHPETEIISLAYKFNNDATHVIFGEDKIRRWIASVDWSDKLVVGHNLSGFDVMPLVWRFGLRPRLWACTLSMSKPIHAKEAGGSLAALVKHYNLGVKDQTALLNTKGRHLCDFTPEEIEAMREYNAADVDQCWGLFQKLLPLTSKDEMRLIDATIRMLVEPQFVVDRPLLETTLKEEKARKRKSLLDLSTMLGAHTDGMDEDEAASAVLTTLGSAAKFSALLNDLGVEVPTKISPTTGKEAPALAKTDEAFIALQEHENPLVAAAAQARLGAKSTILESRIEAFLEAADAAGGKLPVPIKYYGADTTGRDSGWAYNPQNLPRVSGKPSDALRNCLTAGPGKKIVVADLSGIELRVNMFLWKVPYAMALFQADPEKADLYKTLASEVLHVPYDEIVKMQRQAGKAMHLGCIEEGALVLTDHGLIPIEKVLTCMQVWDGVEWVQHEGPIYKGIQEVITYDSLTATPDHIVYLRDGSSCRFDKAAAENLEIAHTGDGREAVRVGEDFVDGVCDAQQAPLRPSPVHEVLTSKDDRAAQFEARTNSRVPEMQPAKTSSEMVGSAHHGYEAAVYQSERPCVPELRRTGDSVSVRVCTGSGVVDTGASRAEQSDGIGSDRQQRALRTGELAMGDRPDADSEPAHDHWETKAVLSNSGEPPGGALRRHDVAEPLKDLDRGSGSASVAPWEVVQTKRRVWDLLNAGCRHRFTVNGRLVSNCGFGLGSTAKYRAVAKSMAQIVVTEEEAAQHIAGYRTKHPEIVQGWRNCHEALRDIHAGIVRPIDPWELCWTHPDGIRTPKGMIRYPNLRQEVREEDGKKEWVYGDGRHKARIYAGKVTENCVQHLARNVIMGNALDIHRKLGLYPALRVHDELVYVVDEDKADGVLAQVQDVMRTPPVWWPELVTWSEGDIGDTYGASK